MSWYRQLLIDNVDYLFPGASPRIVTARVPRCCDDPDTYDLKILVLSKNGEILMEQDKTGEAEFRKLLEKTEAMIGRDVRDKAIKKAGNENRHNMWAIRKSVERIEQTIEKGNAKEEHNNNKPRDIFLPETRMTVFEKRLYDLELRIQELGLVDETAKQYSGCVDSDFGSGAETPTEGANGSEKGWGYVGF